MKLFYFLLSSLFIISTPLSAKVRILTFHYNKPDFIELQHRTLATFFQNDYELIVFNDAPDGQMEMAVKNMCEKCGVTCIRYEQQWHSTDPLNEEIAFLLQNSENYSHLGFSNVIANQPSIRHCHVIQYALDNFGYDHNDIVVLMDGDFFPMRPVNLRELMKEHDIIGAYKYFSEDDVGYLWVAFTAMNMPRLPDKHDLKFHADIIKHKLHDSGSHTYHYLKNHPNLRVKKYHWNGSSSSHYIAARDLLRQGYNYEEIAFAWSLPKHLCVEFHIDHHFVHFGASSFGLEDHDIKSTMLTDYLNKIVGE